MTIRIFWHALVFAVVLTAAGAAHGYFTDRWNLNADQLAKMQSLAAVAPALGDWVGEDMPIDESATPNVRTFCRRYTRAAGGRVVMTSVAVGRPGRVSTHTPDYCFPGSGFELTGMIDKEEISLGSHGTAQFYTAVFTRKRASGAESLRVRWSWTVDGRWTAPEYPRLAFAREPVLLKLYLVSAAPAEGAESDARSDEEFAARFVTELNGRLFTAP